MYIEMGILKSSVTGTVISFRYPPENAGYRLTAVSRDGPQEDPKEQ